MERAATEKERYEALQTLKQAQEETTFLEGQLANATSVKQELINKCTGLEKNCLDNDALRNDLEKSHSEIKHLKSVISGLEDSCESSRALLRTERAQHKRSVDRLTAMAYAEREQNLRSADHARLLEESTHLRNTNGSLLKRIRQLETEVSAMNQDSCELRNRLSALELSEAALRHQLSVTDRDRAPHDEDQLRKVGLAHRKAQTALQGRVGALQRQIALLEATNRKSATDIQDAHRQAAAIKDESVPQKMWDSGPSTIWCLTAHALGTLHDFEDSTRMRETRSRKKKNW